MSIIGAAPTQMPHRRRSVFDNDIDPKAKTTSTDVVHDPIMEHELSAMPSDSLPSPGHTRNTSDTSQPFAAWSPSSSNFPPQKESRRFSLRMGSISGSSPTSSAFSFRAARNSIISLSSVISSGSGSGSRKGSMVGDAVRRIAPASSNPDDLPPTQVAAAAPPPNRVYMPKRAASAFMASVTPLAERAEVEV